MRTQLSEAEAYKEHRRSGWRSEPISFTSEGVREGARRHQDQALSRGHGEDPAEGATLCRQLR